MRKGEEVTVSFLTKLFKRIKTRLNEISNIQVVGVSVGQIIGIGVDQATETDTVVNTIMSVGTEQYFDSSENIQYLLPESNDVFGGEQWFDHWLDEIKRLEEL